MLPGLRLVAAAISATIVLVVLGFALLVKLQVAQSGSVGLVPMEARFAGLAFAARADWTPVSTARPASLESLAPFAAGPPPKPPSIGEADAVGPAQSSELPHYGREPPLHMPPEEPAPVVMAFVVPDLNVQTMGSQAVPEVGLPAESIAVGSTTDAVRIDAGVPELDIAALSAAVPEPSPAPAPSAAESHASAIPLATVTIPALSVPATPAAPAIPAVESVTLIPAGISSLPAEETSGVAEIVATRELSRSGDAVMVPIPRPATLGLASVAPLPVRRPTAAAPRQRKAQPRPAKKKAARAPVRRPALPARPSPPPASAASTNPFRALFGGSNRAGTAPN